MFAIVQIGSLQYKVSEGDTIEADQIEDQDKKTVSFDKVLLFSQGADIRVGQPYLKDVKVTAKIVKETLGKKLVSFKYRRRKSSKSKIGHRQKLMAYNITKISV